MSKLDTAAVPLDARTLASILSSMGIDDYDDRVIHQLLELLYRYMAEVLTDARDVAEHARRGQSKTGRGGSSGGAAATATGEPPELDLSDVKLAIELKLQREFVQPPPREVQMLHARELNAIPLPVYRGDRDTVELPPEELQLTAPVFRVVARKRKQTPGERLPATFTDGAAYSTALAVSAIARERAAQQQTEESAAVPNPDAMETDPAENGNEHDGSVSDDGDAETGSPTRDAAENADMKPFDNASTQRMASPSPSPAEDSTTVTASELVGRRARRR